MDVIELSLAEASELISAGELSPVELTEAYLARIAQWDPAINSFLTVTGEAAIRQAQHAEREIQEGSWRGPLHGIPLGLKDLFATRGVRTTAGASFLAGNIPDENAAVVDRLQAAGALILGKLNMHEIALGVTNVNPHYGACRNPWDLERVAGGSSGGSAAALAARFCPGALGSDTGGSIRIPAALCGVVGLKPTRGRVSLRGVYPLSWNLDHAGPLARQVRDVALLLQALAGYDPHDPYSIKHPVDDYLDELSNGVRGWRLALARGEFFTKVTEPEVEQVVLQAAQLYEALGAIVEEVEFSQAGQAAAANGLMTTSDAAAFHRERLEQTPEVFGKDVVQRLRTGASFTSTEYVLARRTQTMLRHAWNELFNNYDVLLTPTTPIAAPPVIGPDAVEQARRLTRFTAPFNLTGFPAISLPCGFTQAGLPVGLQLVGGLWQEARLLRAAQAYQQATDWHLCRPRTVFAS